MEKTIFKSKTALVQVLTIIAAFVPAVQQWLAENPALVLSLLASVNLLVRFFTSKKVKLFPVSSHSIFPLMLLFAGICMACLGGTSCSQVRTVAEQVDFRVFKKFDDGAKAGLKLSNGQGVIYGRKAFIDEDGNVMFEVDTEIDLIPRPQVLAEK